MSSAGWEQVIVIVIVALAAACLGIHAYRSMFRKDPGCGSCSGCPSRSRCEDTLSVKIDESKKRSSHSHEG